MCTASHFLWMNSYLEEKQELQGVLYDKMAAGLMDVYVYASVKRRLGNAPNT